MYPRVVSGVNKQLTTWVSTILSDFITKRCEKEMFGNMAEQRIEDRDVNSLSSILNILQNIYINLAIYILTV